MLQQSYILFSDCDGKNMSGVNKTIADGEIPVIFEITGDVAHKIQ